VLQYFLVFFLVVVSVFQTMDSLSRRLRNHVPKAGGVPSLLDLCKLIQSAEKRLVDRLKLIENDLKQRLCGAQTPLEKTSPWPGCVCVRFCAGRPGVRLSVGSYQDLIQ